MQKGIVEAYVGPHSYAKPEMSSQRVSRDWREFEKRIARIEAVLAPRGAVVKSPDRVQDLVLGSWREVDASIRYRLGTVPVLITIECRLHKATQDDTWIEQLASKRQKIGAAKTIAVSSSGFSEPAIKTANLYGIELRQVDELSAEEILGWLNLTSIVHRVQHSTLEAFNAQLRAEPGDQSPPTLAPDVAQAFEADLVNAPVFTTRRGSRTLTVNDLWRAVQLQNPDVYEGVPDDGSKVRRNFKIELPKGLIYVETTDGPRSVETLELGFDLFIERLETPAITSEAYVYSDVAGPIVHATEHLTSIFGRHLQIIMMSEVGSNEVHMIIQASDADAEQQDAASDPPAPAGTAAP